MPFAGTVGQAVVLGLSAMVSHTAIVRVVALGGQAQGRGVDATSGSYLQIASRVIVAGFAVWIIRRIGLERRQASAKASRSQRSHPHLHGEEVRRVDTGHGIMALEIFETGVPPRWRIRFETGRNWTKDEVVLVTERRDGARHTFGFVERGDHLESVDEIQEPHEFALRIGLHHDRHIQE